MGCVPLLFYCRPLLRRSLCRGVFNREDRWRLCRCLSKRKHNEADEPADGAASKEDCSVAHFAATSVGFSVNCVQI